MKKKYLLKTFIPISAVAAVFGLAASDAHAQNSTVFQYAFPASWNGTGTTITDQGPAGNNGFSDGTLALSSAVPTGAASGTQSIDTSAGGILTSATGLLNNSAIAGGGFIFNLSFMWNGTDSTSFSHTQKLIDYAGTESLQLITSASSASLQMTFANDAGAESTPVSTTVLPNVWYNVELAFVNTSMVGADVAGTANLYVNGSLVSSGSATKGTYGDGLNRNIGIGQLGANFGYLVGFKGDIYDPSVTIVPEPSTLVLGALGGLGMFLWRRKS